MLGFDGTRAAGLVLAYLLHSVVAVIQLTNGVDGVMYPYSYHEPTDLKSQGCNGKVPVIFHLGGMGIFRQAGEDVISNTIENGLGQLLSEYDDNPTELRRKIVHEQVLMILPDPAYDANNQHYDPVMLEGVFSDVSKKFGSKIDTNRIYYVGYSAGCRGVIRWAESNPARPAGIICVAGGAEKSPNPEEIVKKGLTNLEGHYYGWRLTQAMPETFTKLNVLKDLPIYLVSGGAKDKMARGDLDHPTEAPWATYNALPNKEIVKYIDLLTDHNSMSMAPYTTGKVDVLGWLLAQRKAQCSASRRFGRSLNVHRARTWAAAMIR